MAAVISENALSRSFRLALAQSERELIFDVGGTEDEEEVRTTVQGTAPAVYLGRTLDEIDCEPLGGGVWKARCRYVTFDDGSEYTFETGGGTQKRTLSYATASYAAPGQMAPDFGGLIGVGKDRLEGVDITAPTFQFTETHRFGDSLVTPAYKLAIFRLTGKVNDAAFKGLAAGECLFLGASGSRKGSEEWSISYRFAGSPNATGLTLGNITGITKDGHDHLWTYFDDFEDAGASALVLRPIAAYVERVYERDDFAALNIGT